MSYDELCDEVHEMCNLQQEQPITLKWIDDEGIVLKCCLGIHVSRTLGKVCWEGWVIHKAAGTGSDTRLLCVL